MMWLFFKVPLVPFTPGASILLNVFLMMKLSYLTWIRFTVWIAAGKKRDGCVPNVLKHSSLV